MVPPMMIRVTSGKDNYVVPPVAGRFAPPRAARPQIIPRLFPRPRQPAGPPPTALLDAKVEPPEDGIPRQPAGPPPAARLQPKEKPPEDEIREQLLGPPPTALLESKEEPPEDGIPRQPAGPPPAARLQPKEKEEPPEDEPPQLFFYCPKIDLSI